jgi:23S rRNA (guanine2535-N1)-methyltransferase
LSHAEALESAERFLARVAEWREHHQVTTYTFVADATNGRAAYDDLEGWQVDLVLLDVPYGQHSEWRSSEEQSALWQMLEALKPLLSAGAVVAIAADKGQRIAHENYRRLKRFQVGKRQIVLLATARP